MMDIIGRPDFTGKTHSLRGVDGLVSHHIDPKITKMFNKWSTDRSVEFVRLKHH